MEAKRELGPMTVPKVCARCLTINTNNTMLCAWCAMEDSRLSHRLDGHTLSAVDDCPACLPPPPPPFL